MGMGTNTSVIQLADAEGHLAFNQTSVTGHSLVEFDCLICFHFVVRLFTLRCVQETQATNLLTLASCIMAHVVIKTDYIGVVQHFY